VTDTTYEEAKRCPKCEEPGQEVSNKPGPRGSRMHTFRCPNQRCKWYSTDYIVQVNADGTIPDPDAHRIKNFPALPTRSDEAVERTNQFLLNQTLAGGETK
jgi:hypothetical protein